SFVAGLVPGLHVLIPSLIAWMTGSSPVMTILAGTGPHFMPDNLPRIAVIGTGGTISSLGASSMDVLDYPDFGQKLTSEALIERFPETRLVAEPVPVTFRQVGSTATGPAEWIELRDLIHRIARDQSPDDLPLARFRRAGACRWRRPAFLPRALEGAHAGHALRAARDRQPAEGRRHLLLCLRRRRSDRGGDPGGREGPGLRRLRAGHPEPIPTGRVSRCGEIGNRGRAMQPRLHR